MYQYPSRNQTFKNLVPKGSKVKMERRPNSFGDRIIEGSNSFGDGVNRRTPRIRAKVLDEEGSISLLIIALFLIALVLSISLVNISDAYIAKRELIQIAEEIAQKSAQSLDYSRYYLDDSNWEAQNRTPLDCLTAKQLVSEKLLATKLRGRDIALDSVSCEADFIHLNVHSNISPIVDFPLFRGITGSTIKIDASVEAATILGN